MAIDRFAVSNYRSIRDVRIDLGPINVLVGANGAGKTNLYRALTLIAASAEGSLAQAFATEGGLPSALWAGERKKHERASLSIEVETEMLGYRLRCGVPVPQGGWIDAQGHRRGSAFNLDPEVKEEAVWILEPRQRKTVMAERKGPTAWVRDGDGRRVECPVRLDSWGSMLGQLQEPGAYPELFRLRRLVGAWRFYHLFRTDPDAPLRQPQVGVRTVRLADDGRDLAAALQTILEIGDTEGLYGAVDDAFPGSRLEIDVVEGSRFAVLLHMPGMARPFAAPELSDGTLRYLCLLAALESPRPAPVLAFNEPEASLHPDLLVPLAHAMTRRAHTSQLWVTTHSRPLADALRERARDSVHTFEVTRDHTGATHVRPS